MLLWADILDRLRAGDVDAAEMETPAALAAPVPYAAALASAPAVSGAGGRDRDAPTPRRSLTTSTAQGGNPAVDKENLASVA